MSEIKYCFLNQKNIIFIGVMCRMRERLFSFFSFSFFGKQPIENKPYFYKSFPLTKNSFPLTNFFLCYQTLKNVENYLYRKFSNETNRALLEDAVFIVSFIKRERERTSRLQPRLNNYGSKLKSWVEPTFSVEKHLCVNIYVCNKY